jgi:CRISPR-associated endonuclease/helicase Cas3
MMAGVSAFLSFWGKGQPVPGAAAAWHPAAFHNLDVAAVASVWLAADSRRLACVCEATGWSERDWTALVVFLLALHDIGKFSRPFQAKERALWPAALLGSWPERLWDPGHDTLGYALLTDTDQPLAWPKPLLPRWSAADRHALLRAVTGHHGRPPASSYSLTTTHYCAHSRTAAATFVTEVVSLLAPPDLPPLRGRVGQRGLALATWWLAGLAVMADWVGSAQRWFPYVAPETISDLPAYWQTARTQAGQALREAGLCPVPSGPLLGFSGLFPRIDHPTPVQTLADTLSLPPGPVCMLVEDATGDGKTEVALLLAHRLITQGRADGVFVALPTMATADAMFERVATSCRRLFDAGTNPSLVLTHGHADLNAQFSASILPGVAVCEHGEAEAAGQSASAQCTAWLADDRRLAFLAQVGIGTIDQALLAVLPARHAPLRLYGLARKVLIVDEAHAYDPFMTEELARLLEFHAAMGGSAVVLSATLPRRKREALLAAFRAGLGGDAPEPFSEAYPLVSVAGRDSFVEIDKGTDEQPLKLGPGLARTLPVRRLDGVKQAAEALAAASRAGACGVWVRNTVDDAIAAVALLRAAGTEPMLFHARFPMGRRLEIQAEVLRGFNRESGPAERAPGGCGRVLVATQVVEQSLDLDFDVMVSDLAPIDLLIQRAGRLWRHTRLGRPVAAPELLVVSPEAVADAKSDWAAGALGGTCWVYRLDVLWRSARALFTVGVIDAPSGIRALVEAGYDEEGLPVPPGLASVRDKDDGKDLGDRGVALSQLLDFRSCYRRESCEWERDTRIATRLSDLRTVIRLGRLEGGRLLPWCADAEPCRAWAFSEVSLRGVITSDEAAVSPALSEAVRQERQTWPAWQREIPLLVLESGGNGWGARVRRGDRTSKLLYHPDIGLTWDCFPAEQG